MLSFLKKALTGWDDETLDIWLLGVALGLLVFLVLTVCAFFMQRPFSFTEFAAAYGIMLTSGAAALRFKNGIEQGPKKGE